MAKVLGIVGSLRKGGNTEILVKESLEGAKELNAETELLTLAGKDIRPCVGCMACCKTGKCHIIDDMQEIYEKLKESHAIIFGSPVYFCSVSSIAKLVIDRTFALRYKNEKSDLKLKDKVGGVIVVGERGGHEIAMQEINHFFMAHQMLLVGLAARGFGRLIGDVKKDKRAMIESRELGRRVAMLAKEQFKFPKPFELVLYRTA